MSVQKIPVFRTGNILTQEMLDILKEYAIDAEKLKYAGYADGVLKGCTITTAPGVLTVGKGIVIVKARPFYINSEITISVEPTNTTQILVVRATEEEETMDFVVREVEVVLTTEANLLNDDVEICRFRLQSGAALRTAHRDYKDMDTEFDTVCYKYAKWAAYGEYSVSLAILEKFAEEAMQSNITDPEDKRFLSRIAATDGTTLTRKEISLYLAWRLNRTYKDQKPEEIYQSLAEVLRQIQGGRPSAMPGRTMPRKIIVD